MLWERIPLLKMMRDFLSRMKVMLEDLKRDLTGKISDVEKSITYTSSQMEDMLAGFNELKKTFKQLEDKQEALAKENTILKKTVKDLKNQVLDMDQKSLDHSLEITGIPDTVESHEDIMEALCEKVKVQVPPKSNYTIKRVSKPANSSQGKPKLTIVQFESKCVRDEILKASKKYKPTVANFTKCSTDPG